MICSGLLTFLLLQPFAASVSEVHVTLAKLFGFPDSWNIIDPFKFFHNIPKPDELFQADAPEEYLIPIEKSPLVYYTTADFIVHYGYLSETYNVTTKDGYILQLHRILPGKGNKKTSTPREPVIIMHGLLSSSTDWVMNPPSQSIGFLMADAGYDVWLPNMRGNTYSRTHTTLDKSSKEFWQFSWHEMGVYDLPAIIDFVLSKTGFSKLHYVGHSMGTTSFFVMMDQHPEYNDKVSDLHAMAPVTAVDNMGSPLHILSPLLSAVRASANLLHIWQFAPSNAVTSKIATWFCANDDYTQFICENSLSLLCGYNSKQLNTSMLPVYFAHTPAGASMRSLWHYGETLQTGVFQPYLHDRDKHDPKPAPYDLKKTTTPTFIYWGANDWMADPKDVKETVAALPNVKRNLQVDDPKWTHSDFMWGIEANRLVYAHVIDDIRSISL